MAHNGAKTAQKLAEAFRRKSLFASGCEESVWRAVAYIGSKRPAAGTGDSSPMSRNSSHSGDSSHKRLGTPLISTTKEKS